MEDTNNIPDDRLTNMSLTLEKAKEMFLKMDELLKENKSDRIVYGTHLQYVKDRLTKETQDVLKQLTDIEAQVTSINEGVEEKMKTMNSVMENIKDTESRIVQLNERISD